MILREIIKYAYPVFVFLVIGNGYEFDNLLWNGVFFLVSSFMLPIIFLIEPTEYLKKYHNFHEDVRTKYSNDEIKVIAYESMFVFKEKHPKLFLYNLLIKYFFWIAGLVSIIFIISGLIQRNT